MSLHIQNLQATLEDGTEILKGVTLEIPKGEVHAIMGPNGAGKSTLGYVLSGREGYEITGGDIEFDGQDLTELDTEERAQAGLFLAFQYPVEIPGVSNMEFLKASVDAIRLARGQEALDAISFMKLAREKCKAVNLDQNFLKRGVNEGFSGGEKKRNETMQLGVLEPKFAILDELDSGLDIDALRDCARRVEAASNENNLGVLAITHYVRLFEELKPDVVHILVAGRIVASGGPELADQLEIDGYAAFV